MAIQALNVLTGFFLLRWLSITAYAQFSVAFAFQSTVGMLIDLGFSSSIIALVGDRVSDKKVLGNYIRSGLHFRNRMFVVMIVISSIAFPLMTHRQHWNTQTSLLLFASIILSLFFQGWSVYSTPLLIHRRIKPYYGAQILSAGGRIVLCSIFHMIGILSASLSAWTAATVLAMNGFLFRRAAHDLIAQPKHSDPCINAEMIHYASPLIPAVVFTAFQAQIALALITVFGHTRNVADVAALGRLGQLFTVLGAFTSVVIQPYLAKLPTERLARTYLLTVMAAVAVASFIGLTAYLFPEPFLWLLGPKYQNLRSVVALSVAGACVAYVSSVIWMMNNARKWRYWWYSWLEVILAVGVQIMCILNMNMSTTRSVLYFSLFTSIAVAFTHVVGGTYGLLKTNREQSIIPLTVAEGT